MLGHTFRYQVYNSTGVSVTCTIKTRNIKFGTDGVRIDDTETTPLSATAVSTLTYSNTSNIDNSTNKWLASDIILIASPGATATGTVTVFLQRSTDGGTTWPTNGYGQYVCAITFAASAASATTNGIIR